MQTPQRGDIRNQTQSLGQEKLLDRLQSLQGIQALYPETGQEILRQTQPEGTGGASQAEDITSWEQLAARPEIRQLIESREIRVPGEHQRESVKLQHYQNHVEKVEQLREEQQEQFQKLMERAAIQEEQLVRIEEVHRELKERLREQEERRDTVSQDERVLQKFQEQLRLERLRRGLL